MTHNEVINALDDFGEEEVLDLLQKQFVGGNASTEAVIQVYRLSRYSAPCDTDFVRGLVAVLSQQHRYCWRSFATCDRFSNSYPSIPSLLPREYTFV